MRADRLEEAFDIEIEWQPFELHPEIPPEGRTLGDRGRAYYRFLQSIAEAEGLPFTPPVRVPNSHPSLEAAEHAREAGRFRAYHRALFDAYFREGRDIGDTEVLVEIAGAQGIDRGSIREALASGRYRALVDERTDEARMAGVTGTPTFVFEAGERRFPIVGAQEYAVFENVASRLGATRREPRT